MWSSLIGNHQKINRVARKKLGELTALHHFPSDEMLHYFEGTRGPDGIKLKSPGANEPAAFYDPFDPDDSELLEDIMHHYQNLVTSLRDKNHERAAFDASWLSHSLVDGLTPAHHYPYEAELSRIKSESAVDTAAAMRPTDKVHIKGGTPIQTARNSWKIWGVKGLLLTHTTFEGGVAFTALPLRFKSVQVDMEHIRKIERLGVDEYFKQAARRVALMRLYEQFYKAGWTFTLAQQVREALLPEMIEVVTTVWYLALKESGLITRKAHANN